MRYKQIIERLRDRAALSYWEGERVVHAAIAALDERLLPDERRWFSAELPPVLGEIVLTVPATGQFDVASLHRSVARRASLTLRCAREYFQFVCEALSELLPWDVVTRLRTHLPAPVALLFTPRPPPPVKERSPAH